MFASAGLLPNKIVYDDHHCAVLIIELKLNTNTDAQWAAQVRQNWLEAGRRIVAPYFLLALPDRFYLWVNAGDHFAEPDYVVNAEALFAPFYEKQQFDPQGFTEIGFEMLVTFWLEDVANSNGISARRHAIPEWLEASGLLHILRTFFWQSLDVRDMS